MGSGLDRRCVLCRWQDWIRRLRALLQQGADVEGSLAQEQLNWLMEQYAQVRLTGRSVVGHTVTRRRHLQHAASALALICIASFSNGPSQLSWYPDRLAHASARYLHACMAQYCSPVNTHYAASRSNKHFCTRGA